MEFGGYLWKTWLQTCVYIFLPLYTQFHLHHQQDQHFLMASTKALGDNCTIKN